MQFSFPVNKALEMQTVLLIAYTFIVIALVAVVLMQRSEGGALGIGGGGGGGFMSSRGAANTLTRLTSGLGALFFAGALGLAMISDRGTDASELQRELTGEETNILAPGGSVESDDLLESFGEGLTLPETTDDTAEETPAADVPAEEGGNTEPEEGDTPQ